MTDSGAPLLPQLTREREAALAAVLQAQARAQGFSRELEDALIAMYVAEIAFLKEQRRIMHPDSPASDYTAINQAIYEATVQLNAARERLQRTAQREPTITHVYRAPLLAFYSPTDPNQTQAISLSARLSDGSVVALFTHKAGGQTIPDEDLHGLTVAQALALADQRGIELLP